MADLSNEEIRKIVTDNEFVVPGSYKMSEADIDQAVKNLAELIKNGGNTNGLVKGKPVDTTNNFAGFVDQILWPEFKQIKNKVGLFGFINGESCTACTQYLKNLKNLGTLKTKMTLVLLMKNHMDEVLQKDGVSVPFTRIYNGGAEPIWEVQGVLYSTQIESLYKAYKTLKDGSSFRTMDEFKVYPAKSRVMDVQAFDVKEYLNINILGKTVVARPGQVVVLWRKTGFVEVLDGQDFDERFDKV